MKTAAASAVGARRHNENDVTMTMAGLWRYDDRRRVATGCTALVNINSPKQLNSRSNGVCTCGGRVASLPDGTVSTTAKCADACVISRLFLARHSYMPD